MILARSVRNMIKTHDELRAARSASARMPLRAPCVTAQIAPASQFENLLQYCPLTPP